MAKAKSKKKEKKMKKHQESCEQVAVISPDRFDEMRQALQARVKASRYRHSLGVSQTAEQLARIYGVDQNEAAVAGLLHDWDKSLTGDELKRKAKKLKLADKEVREHATGVLHSWTAAATLRDEFPELSDTVLQAISRHTCGAVGMSDLDMVVFVADIIEPGRDFPDIEGLRAAVGEVCLEELFYRTYKANFMYLLSADMVVAPPSLDVYNSLVVERKERLEAERAACDAPAGGEASEAQLLAAEIARREHLAREAEQQMALARKAAEERERVREEKRAKMQAEAAEARAKLEARGKARLEALSQPEPELVMRSEQNASSQGESVYDSGEAAGVKTNEASAATSAQASAEPPAALVGEQPEKPKVERTPNGARIIPIQ